MNGDFDMTHDEDHNRNDCTNRLNSYACGEHMQHTPHTFPTVHGHSLLERATVTLETRQKERNRAKWEVVSQMGLRSSGETGEKFSTRRIFLHGVDNVAIWFHLPRSSIKLSSLGLRGGDSQI